MKLFSFSYILHTQHNLFVCLCRGPSVCSAWKLFHPSKRGGSSSVWETILTSSSPWETE